MAFTKGVSGNPSGRPKGYKRMAELCRAETEKNIKALIRVRDDPGSSGADVVKAVEAMQNRAWGKPAQTVIAHGVSHDDENRRPMGNLSAEELRARARGPN